MKRFLLALILCGVAFAQSVTDWKTTPPTLTAFVTGARCDFFGQHPAAGQIQVACYLGTTLVFNGVLSVSTNQAFTCSSVSPNFNIAFSFIPDTPPTSKFQIAAQTGGSGLPLFFAAPIQSSPGVATLGGGGF